MLLPLTDSGIIVEQDRTIRTPSPLLWLYYTVFKACGFQRGSSIYYPEDRLRQRSSTVLRRRFPLRVQRFLTSLLVLTWMRLSHSEVSVRTGKLFLIIRYHTNLYQDKNYVLFFGFLWTCSSSHLTLSVPIQRALGTLPRSQKALDKYYQQEN